MNWKRLCNLALFVDLGKRSIHSLMLVCQSEYRSIYVTSILLVVQFVSFTCYIVIPSNDFRFLLKSLVKH